MTEGCLLLLLAAGILTLFWEQICEMAHDLHLAAKNWYASLQRIEIIEHRETAYGGSKEDALSHHLKTLLQLTLGTAAKEDCGCFWSCAAPAADL